MLVQKTEDMGFVPEDVTLTSLLQESHKALAVSPSSAYCFALTRSLYTSKTRPHDNRSIVGRCQSQVRIGADLIMFGDFTLRIAAENPTRVFELLDVHWRVDCF